MPGRNALLRIASPGIAHAEAGDERHPPVDAHRLAVIAVHPSERARPVEGVERPDLDSRFAQGPPDAGTRREAAQPVKEHAHLDAVAGASAERVHELLP